MAKKTTTAPKTVTYKIVAGRKTRFITASPETIQAAVDKAISEMTA